MTVEPTELVDDVMREWPTTIRVFLNYRLRCVGCPIACFHSVDDACREHGEPRAVSGRPQRRCRKTACARSSRALDETGSSCCNRWTGARERCESLSGEADPVRRECGLDQASADSTKLEKDLV